MKGKLPQALKDKPVVPWYYKDFLKHFSVLSASRTFNATPALQNKSGQPIRLPNPIDITTVLCYNEKIADLYSPQDFLEIIQTLDSVFMELYFGKDNAN